MEADKISLCDFFDGKDKRFLIPVFQRNYDWHEEQCKQLFLDLKTLINEDKRKFHFLGTIVYISNDEVATMGMKEYLLIDGQQRIITISLLFKALLDFAIENKEEKIEELKDRIGGYLVNKYADEKNKMRLKPMKEDDAIYRELMNDSFENSESSSSNIFKNYSYFKKEMKESGLSVWDIYEGIKRLVVVYISLKRGEDDPQLIFESLNSTGLGLSEGDLIRNYVLMDKTEKEQEEFFINYWHKIESKLSNPVISEFIKDFLTMENSVIPKKNRIYFEFKKYAESLEQTSEELLKNLLYYAKIYYSILNASSENLEVDVLLSKILNLNIGVCYPFIMRLLHNYKNENISFSELKNSLELIVRFCFRRSICEKSTNELNKIFSTLYKDIEKKRIKENLEFFQCMEKILLDKRFPDDKEFESYFCNKNIYKFRHQKFLFEELESYNNKEKIDFEKISIEHIMPQTLSTQWKAMLGGQAQIIHEKYLNNIGNLTLTGYNSELSNNSFSEKKIMYSSSNIRLTKDIVKNENWGEEEILRRAKELLSIALKIWEYPKIKIERNLQEKEEYNFYDEIDVTNTKPKYFILLEKRYEIESWKAFFIAVSEFLMNFDSDRFLAFSIEADFKRKQGRIVSKNIKDVRISHKLKKDLYLETNLSANAILNYTKLMLEKFELSDDFLFSLVERK